MTSHERLARVLDWIKGQNDLVSAYRATPTKAVLGKMAERAVRDGIYSPKTVTVDIFPRLKRYMAMLD